MRMLDYLYSRAAYIIGHLLACILCLCVIQLDLLQTGQRGLTIDSAIYIVVLHVAVLVVVLIIDYSRQNQFYQQMSNMSDDFKSPEEVLSLAPPRTAEQRIASNLVRLIYAHHAAEVLKRDERSQFHIDFTNRWAHAMKTPVSVVDLLIQQSKEVVSLDEAATLFESIQEENERIAHGLDMMLGMARQERFSVDVWPQQVDLEEVAREVINKHKKEFIRYSIYPRLEVSTGNTHVETDQKWIAFVIDQLVSNAIKYTRISPTGSKVVLHIQKERDLEGIILAVEDDGVGIPPHDYPRIFDPFFTGENGRLVPESTGMGLYLAKGICGELGHALTVRSKPGCGTTMAITFSTRSITHFG
ncbi:MAG: sensor histidine kinase [Limnochordia bacterium]|nr:sensor histidine kinase [Limnochordia bacterium]